MNKNYDNISEGINEYTEEVFASRLMATALKEIRPTKKNLFAFVISSLISLISSCYIGFSTETVVFVQEIASKFMDIQVSIFGCILAVYSILLAFLNEDLMQTLLKHPSKERDTSVLKSYTSYYESILFLYFIGMCLSGILMLFVGLTPEGFILTASYFINCLIATILIFIYMFYSVRIFYELKSMIYHTIMLFRASIVYKFTK